MDATTEPKAVKGKETARDKFLRLAPARMDAALKKISLIGNLAGSGYRHEPEEAAQIVESLTNAVKEVRDKFNRTKAGTGFEFKRKRRG